MIELSTCHAFDSLTIKIYKYGVTHDRVTV